MKMKVQKTAFLVRPGCSHRDRTRLQNSASLDDSPNTKDVFRHIRISGRFLFCLIAVLFAVPASTGQVRADDREEVTIVSGTAGPDVIVNEAIIDAQADLATGVSEKIEATATGIDSLAGDDEITVNEAITTTATTNALLLQTPEEKTESIAKSIGITAGEGDDTVDNNSVISAFGSSLGGYGAFLELQPPDPPGDDGEKEVGVSIASQTEMTGIETGEGADSIENNALLTVNGFATSGGSAGDLSATIRESSTFKATAEAEASGTGIQAGGDGDTVVNDGAFGTTATATSGALAVGLVAPGDADPPADKKANIKTESNATSKATVTGIHGDEDETESSADDSSPFGVNGLSVTYEKTVTTVSGDDTIVNNGFLSGNATATSGAGSASVSYKVDGTVETKANAEAEATVTGIDGGGGSDLIENNGELLSTAIATSGALAVAVEIGASEDKENKSSTEAGAKAKSSATGISGDGDAHAETTGYLVEIDDGTLSINYRNIVENLPGNDTVTNGFAIQAVSLATSLTDSTGVTIGSGGSANSTANAEAESYGGSIVTGFGDDTITNHGVLTTESAANATAVSVGLAIGQPVEDQFGDDDPPPPNLQKLTTKSQTNVTAKARGFGIDADGPGENVATGGSLSIGAEGLGFSLSRERELAAGNDSVSNDLAITVGASAGANSTDASIQIDAVGSVDSEAKATAGSEAVGIATGAGGDEIVNSGLLLVEAEADADSLSFGLSVSKPPEGETLDRDGNTKKDKTNVKTDAGATAQAVAAGIDAEGKDHLRGSAVGLDISGSGLNFLYQQEKESLAGNDTVTNTGVVAVSADAVSGAVSAGIGINADGSVESEATSKATATAGGILTGGGDDTVDNQAVLSSGARATATALSVSVSVAQPTDTQGEKPSTWEKLTERFAGANSKANAEATAVASGIDAEGDAGRQFDSVSLDISSDGLFLDVNREFTSAAGDDTVTNSGDLDATAGALALAGAADVKINTEGTASSETNATAKAEAGGLLTGGGADEVTNSGSLTASADAEAGSVSVSFTQPDGMAVQSKTESKSIAQANATGIGTDGGRESQVLDTHVSIGPAGIDFNWHEEEVASAGADTVGNTGDVTATALTLSGAGGGAISMDGSARADVTAKSTSQAVAVDTGGGGDSIDTEGRLIANADAVSGALALSFGQKSEEKSKPKVEVKAGATAESTAIGIRSDSGADKLTDINVTISADGLATNYLNEQSASVGDDEIENRGAIDAGATAVSGGLGVSVAIDGTAKADVNATAKSRASAIEAGGGSDRIVSEGDISATADSAAVALAVAVGKKNGESSSAKTAVEAKTVAEAAATGIAGDGGLDDKTRSVVVNIDDDGLLVEYTDLTTAAAGDDEIINSGAVSSGATAVSGAVSVAVTIDGAARADANSEATAEAAGLNAGAGSDRIDNSGAVTADAFATSATLNVAVTSDGNAVTNAGLMDGGNKAKAGAVGITSAGGQYQKSTTVTGFIDFNDIGVEARYEAITDSISGDGADEIINSGGITATSFALAPEVTAGITGDGLALSIGRTQSEASASAIESGNLGDTIANSGDLVAEATSTSVLANVAVAGKGLAVAANAVWDGGTKAEASANGIDADSGGMTSKVVDARANADVAYVRYTDEFQAASGNDRVVNSGRIDATALALSPSVNVAVEPGMENKTGIAAAVSTSSAEAKANAIRGGDGDDYLDNSGLLNATADANAVSANVAVVNKGVAAAADAVWDGGTKAEAAAIGIAGDGGDRSRTTRLSIGTDDLSFNKDTVVADGTDTIRNSGEVNADATANAGSVGVAVAAKGVGVATSTATAESRAAAIDAGSGDSVDDVYNSGRLTANSTARAVAASVSVTNEGAALSFDSVWDGGTGATAEARGIDLGGGGETLTNDGQIDALADAWTGSATVAVTMKGVAGASATATGKADAVAIDASEGDDADTIINHGQLNAEALANAAAASISVANQGLAIAAGAVWDGGTGAEAVARGIDVGDGADTITNTAGITATTDANTVEIAGSVAVQGVAGAIATATGDSRATAIFAGDEEDQAGDTVTNSGVLKADAEANAATAAVSVTQAGVGVAGGAVWDGGTKAKSLARGIETGGGADTVDNFAAVDALATSRVAEVGVSVAVNGVAGAISTSTGNADAVAIHTGDGAAADQVINSGALHADAEANAATAAVSVTTAGVSFAGGAVWNGGTTATSNARGIATGEGADVIGNSGSVTIDSDSRAFEAAVGVAVSGVTGAIATSTSEASATGIDAGEGEFEDQVYNSGNITVDSDAIGATAAITVTTAGVAFGGGEVWEGGTSGRATTRGIAVGEGADRVENSGAVDVHANTIVAELATSVAIEGVSVANASSTGEADATAIDAGAGNFDDTVINTGRLDAEADALATAAAVAVTKFGASGTSGGAVWDGGTTADARARGIDGGAGADTVVNEAEIHSDAGAISASAQVSVTVAGAAGSIGTSTATADAGGIDVSQGDDADNVTNRGDITANATGLANTATVAVTGAGVAVTADAVWDGGTSSEVRARGIETGGGGDVIDNWADVSATTLAEAASASIAVSLAGVAGSMATATAEADAVALDAGDGEYADSITSHGDVAANSTAIAASAAVSMNAAGVAGSFNTLWDGGTTADAGATSMVAGEGDDSVISDGAVSAIATATSTGLSRAVSVAGAAGAVTAANADADATAIDLGGGDDTAETDGTIEAFSTANANTISLSEAAFGVSVAGNNAWDGGTTAMARSAGIHGGSGLDWIDNAAAITTHATTIAPTASVAYTIGGVALAVSTATGDASVSAIDSGEDDDEIFNSGNLDAGADAVAVAGNLALTGIGVAGGADAVWDGGTTAVGNAQAIFGGAGDDLIDSAATAAVTATANATALSTTATITGGGVSASVTTAAADAAANAIDAGDGDDEVQNASNLRGEANATAAATSLTVTGIGVGVAADAVWDGGTTANAAAYGISGGTGNDLILSGNEQAATNTVTAMANSTAVSTSLSLTGIGLSLSTATATANADASAIDAGVGDDEVYNASDLLSVADANAAAVAASVTGAGVAGATDSFWDGGTKANAGAVGIGGGDGADVIVNRADVTTEADAQTLSIAAAATLNGMAGAAAASTATGRATGLDGGEGDDMLRNEQNVLAKSLADGQGVSVAAVADGFALAGSLDAGTVADSQAVGLSGGAGDDGVFNVQGADVKLESQATSVDTAVAVSLRGIALAHANAESVADAVGLSGGDGNDNLINDGTISTVMTAGDDSIVPGAVTADSTARGIGLSLIGAAVAAADATATATVAGVRGGAGNDLVANNGSMDLAAVSNSEGQSFSVTGAGITISDAGARSLVAGSALEGGGGEDTLLNTGSVAITNTADTTTRAIAVGGLVAAIGRANSVADATAGGASGGAGNDVMLNTETGAIDVLAIADVTAESVSVSIAGASDGEARTLTGVTAIGMSGDAGDDRITNEGGIGVLGRSKSRAASASVSAAGLASARAGTEVETEATGMSGGLGSDVLINSGMIRVGPAEGAGDDARWMAVLESSSSSFGFVGDIQAESAAYARTSSIGMDGGDADDQILNEGTISVIASALNSTSAGSLSIFGSSQAAGQSGAFTLATGLSGGLGNDTIETLEELQVEAESRLIHSGATFNFGGSSGSASFLEARTEAVGISGGEGDDGILAEGDLAVTARSTMISRNGSSAAFGGSGAAGQSGATTRATGIDGGEGNDIIDSAAAMTLSAFSVLDLNGSSFSLGGSGNTAGRLAATTQAEAITGGGGDDQVVNRGIISITAGSTMTSGGDADTGFGSSTAGNISGGVTSASGLSGGDGDDLLENLADAEITVEAWTDVVADAVTYTFAGGTSANNLLTGLSFADGISGGEGNDRLFNDGNLSVSASADLTANGGSKATFTGGGSDATGKSAAGAESVGMDGGEGDDLVVSTGDIEVNSRAVARAQNNSTSTASFTSDQIAGSISETNAEATGLRGGGGNDTLVNEGNLTVAADSTAYSFAYANGATISFDGDAEARSTSTATATATGFSALDGDNVVRNDGQLTVTATAGTAENLVSSLVFYRLQGDYEEDVEPDETSIAQTVDQEPDWNDPAVQAQYADGDILYCTDDACIQNPEVNSSGNHYRVVVEQVDDDDDPDTDPIEEYGWVAVDAVDELPDLSDPAVSSQYADGEIVACTAISCREDPSIESSATYWKVVVSQEGDPPVDVYNWVPQNGLTIEVSVEITESSFPSYAAANANGLDGDGVGRATGVTTANAYGIRLGNGHNTVVSNDMKVDARASTVVNSASDGDVFGDSRGYVDAGATARAYGIVVGDGNDQIFNLGMMAVTATPTAQGYTAVSPGGGICIWFFGWWCAAGGTPEAEARSMCTAEASGILAGNGDNTIINDNSILITAAPEVADDSRRPAEGEYAARTYGDDEGAPVEIVRAHSTAIGIMTGDGNDSVTNNGDIVVEAKDILSGCETGDCGLPADAQATLSASGIVTGAGNDTVINNGAISAQIFRNNIPSPAMAIATGAGDDLLVLGAVSTVTGDIDLGDNDDTLHLIGNPELNGLLTAGTGMNSLVFEGPGFFAADLTGFNDRAYKYGPGTYAVPVLPTMQRIEIEEGTLQTASNYTFAGDGTFQTVVNGDGSHGKLHMTGSTDLAGSLTVLADAQGPYLNGTRYDIIEAEDGVAGTFSEATLPVATRLLSFELNQYPTVVEVEARAESFTTVATNRLERTLAGYMDHWLPIATGDLRTALGEFQTLSPAEYGQAFLGFSPGQYDSLSLAAFNAVRNLTGTLRQRISSVRLLGKTTSGGQQAYFGSGRQPILLAYNGSAESIGRLFSAPEEKKPSFGLWLESFGQKGQQDEEDGFTGFDYDVYGAAIGVDRLFRDRFLLGISLGYSRTDVDMDHDQGAGDIDTVFGSLYGSYFAEKGYVEGVLAYGSQGYDSQRRIVIGPIRATARSDHDGEACSAFVEGGLNFVRRSWVIQPFVNFQYLYLEEDGFTEEGAGGLSQSIESRDTNSLVSELGLRVSPIINLKHGRLVPEASLAWRYDFDIDDRSIESSFAGQPGTSFTLEGTDVEEHGVVVGFGLNYQGRSGFKPSLNYNGEFRDNFTAHSINGELRWEF